MGALSGRYNTGFNIGESWSAGSNFSTSSEVVYPRVGRWDRKGSKSDARGTKQILQNE